MKRLGENLEVLAMTYENTQLTLADICTDISYGYTESATFEEIGPKFLRITDIQGGVFNWAKVPFCSASPQDGKKYRLEVGDIVVARTGNSTGENAQIFTPPPSAVFASYLIRFRPDNNQVNPFFIGYQLRSERFRQHVLSVRGGSAQPGANAKQLGSFPVQILERSQQNAVVNTLRLLDDRIGLLRETNQTLEAITKALFKSWFVDFDPVRAKAEGRLPEGIDAATAALFPDAFEESELGMVPKGWSATTLSTVATFQNGYAFKGSDWSEVGHPVVKIGNVKPLHIDFDGCSFVSSQTVVGLERFKLDAGDLLVGMTGYVGETGLVPHNDTASYLNQRVGRITTNNGLQDLGFVFSAVRQKEFKIYAESQSHGSAQANVSGADLMKFPVTVPSAEILGKYNELTHQFIASILHNHSEATSLTSLRDTLLPRLISGQLRIADAEAELEKAIA